MQAIIASSLMILPMGETGLSARSGVAFSRSISCSTVETPSPSTQGGRRSRAATKRPLTQSRRKSLPVRLVSTMICEPSPPPARAKAARELVRRRGRWR